MKEQIEKIREEIKVAAKHVGKNEEDITLIAVSKTYPVSSIKEAIKLGCRDFGENHVQELLGKIEQVEEKVNWHFIGHLQTNKVKYIVGKVKLIHSVDSIRLAEEIEKQSSKKNCITSILLEVNVGEEQTKYGFKCEEVLDAVKQISGMKHIKVEGLMTVAPYVENPEQNRPIFGKLYGLLVDIQRQKLDNIDVRILSMGMSGDYKVAIEEGANMVRIGTAIFGNRKYV